MVGCDKAHAPRQADGFRLFLGFLLAPLVAPITSIAMAYAITDVHQGDCPFSYTTLFLVYIGVPVFYMGTMVFWLPYILFMRKMKQLDFWAVMAPAGGAAIVLFVLLLVVGEFSRSPGGKEMAIVYPPGIVAAGLSFYVVGVRRARRSSAAGS